MSRLATIGKAAASAPGWALAGVGGLAGELIGGFLGRLSARRQIALASAYHDAARRDSTTADWRARASSADQAILDDLDTMLARSRQMIANDGYAASAQAAYRRYVVGGGITARSSARHPETGAMLDTFNADLDRLWNEYFWEPRLCDAEQTKTLAEKQGVWMNELFAAGGLFVLESYRPAPDGVGLLLQEIEYEQRDSSLYQYGGRPVRGGIETGEYGEPIAYHLFAAAHPLEEYSSRSRRIPAEVCHHLYRQDRIRQRLGAPQMRPVLARLRQLAMYEQYTMIQARTRAAYPGFIKQSTAAGPGQVPAVVARSLGMAGAATPTPDETELRVNLSPGVFPILKPGLEPYFPTPSTPDGMYPAFVLEQLKGIAAGAGLDLATVARWYADGNFSSQRQARLDLWAEVDWIQDVLFIHKILRQVRRRFIELAIAEGRLSAIGFRESPRWRAAYLTTNWQGPPKYSIDEIKDQAAWDMKFKSLRGTPQEYANEQGKDIRDMLSEWREFLDLADKQGLGDVARQFLGANVANRPKGGMQPDGTGDASDRADTSNNSDALAGLLRREAVLRSMLDDGGNGHGRR